jgi:carbonic anhydrase
MLSTAQLIRRHVRVFGLTAVVGTCVLLLATTLRADSGTDALQRLKSGNARFIADAGEALPITGPRRTALAQGQSPFATVLSCADSRVPPEVIFHSGLGDLFVVRSAAHVADKAVMETLEYGVNILHTPLLVVMGHESCGFVKAAIDTPQPRPTAPNLDYLLKALRPAVAKSASEPPDTRLRAAILAHVEETINQLIDTSPVIKRLGETQQLTLVGAYYELATGRVHFSEPVHMLTRPVSSASPRTSTASPATRVAPVAQTGTSAKSPTGKLAAVPAAHASAPAANVTTATATKPGALAAPKPAAHVPSAAPAGGAQTVAAH